MCGLWQLCLFCWFKKQPCLYWKKIIRYPFSGLTVILSSKLSPIFQHTHHLPVASGRILQPESWLAQYPSGVQSVMGRRSAIKNDIIVINTYIHTLSNIHTCTIKHTYISHQIYIHVPSNIHTYPIKHMYLSYQMYIHCPSNVQTYPIKHTTITHQTYIHSPSNKKLLLKYPR